MTKKGEDEGLIRNSDAQSSVVEWHLNGRLEGSQITKWEVYDRCTYHVRKGDSDTELKIITDMTVPFPAASRR